MLTSIAKELEGSGGTLILLHGNADADALASAFAVQQSFPDVVIGVPGGLDRVSKMLSKELDIESVEDVGGVGHKRILILDTSGPEQLEFGPDLSKSIVVDHHVRNAKWEAAKIYYCDDSKSSCSEIVVQLLDAAGKQVSRPMALALLFGILTDTGYFKFAKSATLITVAGLMEKNRINMDEAMNLVGADSDISERISQLKGAQRLRYWRVGEYIVAV
ncbi:MAG TPA: DHH family phosphoesterase, partial [Thermoplasmata archaeon]|nr:DHH family phosphoesterase [Thermoplasmata archaeon]